MISPKQSPKEFLKARSPERFSDSTVEDVAEIDRRMLEYHLETLTSRSEETEFENFARELLKLEICPNILPQTGPTGGGDSKVDSETYPVADCLALAWYIGAGRESASERWAFAFSAKKEWVGKLRSDIAKIAATRRGYKKAFFVSNQFVRDKQRGELEDELTKVHKIDVRILDRTWILNVVFDHRRQDVAIKELGVAASIRRNAKLGPLDLQREATLKTLEERIVESVANEEINFVTVDDCIDAAVISRELERPEHETLGRFDRAETMARKCGTQHQKVRCAYDRAWTSFFWFEDIPKFAELYIVAEERAKYSRNIYDLELLTNLWMLLHGHAQNLTDFQRRTDVLTESLMTIALDDQSPTAALGARAFIAKIELTRAVATKKPCDVQLLEFSQIIKEAESLPGFPFLPLADALIALGDVLIDVAGYEALYAELVNVISRRKGEVEGAKLLIQRAEHQLAADRPVDAIRTIGEALHRLAKDESHKTLIHALYGCACAYERIGLLWAARGTLLTAASISMSDFWRYEDVTPFQAICLRRLKWIELQLGRIPEVLSWHEFDSLVHGILAAQGYDKASLQQGRIEFDAILGILFLKTDFSELKDVVRLPDQLSSNGLDASSVALLHALGHKSEYNSAMMAEAKNQDENSLFINWRDQPASKDLPDRPDFCNQTKVELRSNVLGCAISVTMPNADPFIELGESFLAALECTLATAIVRKLFARTSRFIATIKASDYGKEPFEFAMEDESGLPHLTVTCRSFDTDRVRVEHQYQLKERLGDMVACAIAHIVIPDDNRIEELFRDDTAMSRAINFSGSFQVLGNVLGQNRKRQLSSWIEECSPAYTVKREKAWDAEFPIARPQAEPVKFARYETPLTAESECSKRLQTLRHSNFRTLSLIREALWNRANWRGMGMAVFPDSPPVLSLIFGKRDPATCIFGYWQDEIGKVDEAEALRICIIRHVNRHKPHHYRVVIGSNFERAELGKQDFFAVMSRIQTMTPDSGENLGSFLEAYHQFNAYILAPAVVDGSGQYPESIGDFQILKRELFVREAWEIGRNDIDCVGIQLGDQPIVPDGVDNPPVREVLEWEHQKAGQSEAHRKAAAAKASAEKAHKENGKKKREKRKRQQAQKSRKKN
jgi:hypothetical protein